jgi:uncharacterized protein
MQLEHSFTVPLGLHDAYAALLNIEQVVACMPGAALDSLHGDDFTGAVKVKLGPIALTYKGKASLVEKDPTGHRVVMSAQGRDTRGNGTAAARVTAQLSPDGPATRVDVHTDLDITGKPAQFGRGVMIDVGNKLIGQFAERLAGTLSAAGATEAESPPGAAATEAVPAQPPSAAEPARSMRAHAADDDAIELLSSAGPAVARRLAPPVLATLFLVLLVRRRRRVAQ